MQPSGLLFCGRALLDRRVVIAVFSAAIVVCRGGSAAVVAHG